MRNYNKKFLNRPYPHMPLPPLFLPFLGKNKGGKAAIEGIGCNACTC